MCRAEFPLRIVNILCRMLQIHQNRGKLTDVIAPAKAGRKRNLTMECKNCKFFKGDCGKHFIDDLGHIIYEIPDLNYEGLYDRIECFDRGCKAG